MLQLPVSASALLGSGDSLAFIFLIEIVWPDDGARFYPDRSCFLDDAPLPARLWSVETWRAEAFDPLRPSLPRFQATVRLANLDADDAERFAHRAAQFESLGRPARLLIGFAASGADTSETIALNSDDLVILSPLVLRGWRREGADVLLELADPLSAAGERQAAQPFEPSADAAFPFERSPSQRMPWVFGRVEGHRLIPWRFGPIGELAEDLLPGDVLMKLVSVASFPASGSVQIGAEIIGYAEKGSFLNLLGSESEPLTRSVPAFHRAGEAVYFLPEGGFAWLAAAHGCEAVENLRHARGDIDPADYIIESASVDGRTLTLVQMDALPTVEAGATGRRTLRVDDQDVGASWSAGPFNEADNPAGALAYDDPSQCATIAPETELLQLQCAALPLAGPALGPIQSAQIVVEYAASVAWLEGSVLAVGATDGIEAISREIPRPPMAERTAKSGATIIDLPVNLRRFSFDATDFFGTNWERLQNPHSLFVNLSAAGGEEAEIQITALFWEVTADAPPRLIPQTSLVADVRGWTAGESEMVERPSRLAEAILTQPEAMNLDAALLHDANLDDLEDAETASGWRVARVVDGAEKWGVLLAELLAQAALDLKALGPQWRLERASPSPALENPAETLDADTIYTEPAPRRESPAPTEDRPQDWLIFHGGPDAKAALDFEGLDAIAERALWLPSDQAAVAALFGARLLDASARAGERERVEVAWPALALTWAGDVVALKTNPNETPLPALVRAAEGSGRDGFALESELLAPGVACWTDGERSVIQYAGKLIAVVMGGGAVALLRADSDLLLRGSAAEGQTLPATSAAIEWNAAQGLLVFSAVDGETTTPVFALNASGALQLAGSLQTQASLGTRSDILTAVDGEIALSLSGGTTLLAATASDLQVSLRGNLREFSLL